MLNLPGMRFPKIIVVFAIIVLPSAASGQESFTYQSENHLSPLSWVFDPMAVKGDWVSVHPFEMPHPSGGSEKIRRQVDAQRQQYLQRHVSSRGNYTGTPTGKSYLTPKIDKSYSGGSGGGTPNDNHIAVGNDGKFINVLNTVIRVHSADGAIIKAWSLEYFTVPPNKKVDDIPTLTRVYDPRVIYDPVKDRYIVLYMHGTTDQTSFIVVGFSSTSNPVDPWYVYKIPGKPTNDLIWSDYPIVAHNSEDLLFTVNLIGNGASWEEGFTEAVIWQIRKEDGFKGDTLHKTVFTGIKYKNESLRSICTIQNGPKPEGTDNYFVTMRPLDLKNDSVFMLRLNNTQRSGKAKLELTVLRTDVPYGFPPSALQPDTSYKLRTNDARALSGIRTGNTIQFLQNSMNFKTQQAHITHNFIYNINGNAIVKGGMITDDSLDMGYPAIAPAGKDGDDESAIITFVYSSPWHFPGTAMIYRNRYGEYSKIEKVKKGESLIYYSFIPKGEQRWGDYEGIQWKYNEPGVFYLVGSYGQNNYMNAWVARVKLNDTIWDNPVADVRIFPVPARDHIYAEIVVREDADYQLEMYNLAGQMVREKPKLQLGAGTHLLRIDPENLAPGEYVLKVKNGEKSVHSQKIIIL